MPEIQPPSACPSIYQSTTTGLTSRGPLKIDSIGSVIFVHSLKIQNEITRAQHGIQWACGKSESTRVLRPMSISSYPSTEIVSYADSLTRSATLLKRFPSLVWKDVGFVQPSKERALAG
ncbi:hypothetical protein PABG_04638 [Paracoccidioides brasiliensis Pb03]|nr:hypothetical protein PABG_04638 [Paracoccidioides brasiliensis Pb03]